MRRHACVTIKRDGSCECIFEPVGAEDEPVRAPEHGVGDICGFVLDHLPVGFDLSFFAGREFDRSRAILDLHGALEHRHLCAA